MSSEASTFFELMFGDAVTEDSQLAIWTLPDKKTRFFSDVYEAAEYSISRADDSDVYYGCALYRPGITSGRGKAEDVVSITSVWSDIDIGDSSLNGAKTDRPKSMTDVESILKCLYINPTVLINSGHGIHAYWILKEPCTIEDGAARVAKSWTDSVVIAGKFCGYRLDSVGDLARVLRVPGTYNRKSDPVPVGILYEQSSMGMLYTQEQVEEYSSVTTDIMDVEVSEPVNMKNLTVWSGNKPDPDKLTAITANNKKFALSYDRKRKDIKDDSASGYELSLVTMAHEAGWSDQEKVDLLCHWATRHNLDRKAKYARSDYLRNLLAKSKMVQRSPTKETLSALAAVPIVDSENRRDILKQLSGVLGFPIMRWIQHGLFEAQYSIVRPNGEEILIGPVEIVSGKQKFSNKVYEATGLWPDVGKGGWQYVLVLLGKIRELLPLPMNSPTEQMEEWVNFYVDRKSIDRDPTQEDLATALQKNAPVIKEGQYWIHPGDLSRSIKIMFSRYVTVGHIKNELRRLGWEPDFLRSNTTKHGDKKRGYYRSAGSSFTERAKVVQVLPSDDL